MIDGGTITGFSVFYSVIWSILGLCLLYDKASNCFKR